MNINDVFDINACTFNLSAKTKNECLSKITHLVISANNNFDYDEVLVGFKDRESQGSTGFEDGIGIPHARIKDADSFLVGIALSKRGIDFESIDGKKTNIFFILVGPEDQPNDFLKLLAQISRITSNKKVLREIRKSTTTIALQEAFLRYTLDRESQNKITGNNKLFTLVLYELQYLDDISRLFLQHGIRGTSITDSSGIMDVLSNVPLFANFMNFLGDRKEDSKTITAIIDENELHPLVQGIEDILGDLETHSGAMVYALDLFFMKGSLEVG